MPAEKRLRRARHRISTATSGLGCASAASCCSPRTAAWQEGAQLRGNPLIARGTAIATFESDGSYTSESGSHAAIYLHQDDRGIWVYDQWRGQPVHKRLIRFEGGSGAK